jgi:hypothetical protein
MLYYWNFYNTLLEWVFFSSFSPGSYWTEFFMSKLFFLSFRLVPWLLALNKVYYWDCSSTFNYFLRISFEYVLISFFVLYLFQALWIFLAHAVRRISLIFKLRWLSLPVWYSFYMFLISPKSTSEICVCNLFLMSNYFNLTSWIYLS